MNKKQINRIAHNYVSLAKNDEEVVNLEMLDIRIVPYNVSDEWERLYLMSLNLLNFYEEDMRMESPFVYNLIKTEIANIIQNGN